MLSQDVIVEIMTLSCDDTPAQQLKSRTERSCVVQAAWQLARQSCLSWYRPSEPRFGVQEARTALEIGVSEAVAAGGGASDADLAVVRVALGRAYWQSGGGWREQRKYAQASWLAAAATPGPSQVWSFIARDCTLPVSSSSLQPDPNDDGEVRNSWVTCSVSSNGCPIGVFWPLFPRYTSSSTEAARLDYCAC